MNASKSSGEAGGAGKVGRTLDHFQHTVAFCERGGILKLPLESPANNETTAMTAAHDSDGSE